MAQHTLDFKEMERIMRSESPQMRHIIREVYEIITHQQQTIDQQSSLLLGFAQTLESFVGLSEMTNAKLAALEHINDAPGVSVGSQPIDEE